MSTIYKYRLACETDGLVYVLKDSEDAAPTLCPNNTAHTINGDAVIVEKHVELGAQDSEGAIVSRLKKASWGKNYCMRPLIFTTSKLSSLIDKDWKGDANSGVTLRFYKDVDGDMVEITGDDLNQTYLNANCVETRIEVRYDNQTVEIDTATLFVPDTLAGSDDDAWGYAMVIAPTTAYATGITCLVPLRFHKAETGRYNKLAIGQSVEVMKIDPDTLGGYPLEDGHVMHFVLKHPTGAQTEFMLEGVCYK